MDDDSYSEMVVELWSEFDDWAPLVVVAAGVDSSSAAFDDVAVDVDGVAADGDIDIAVVVVDIVAVVVGVGGVDGGEAPHPPRSTFPTVKTFLKTKKIFVIAHYIYDNLEQQS